MAEQHIVTCPQCRRNTALRLDGKLRKHSSKRITASASSASTACPGGGQSPYETMGARS